MSMVCVSNEFSANETTNYIIRLVGMQYAQQHQKNRYTMDAFEFSWENIQIFSF